MQEYELTILMPCLNEAETLETCIKKAQTFLATNNYISNNFIQENIKELHVNSKIFLWHFLRHDIVGLWASGG